MNINNKYLSIIFKLIILIVGIYGVLAQIGIFSGNYHFQVLNYYTLISNILCIIYFFGSVISIIKGNKSFLPQIKGSLVLLIMVTGLIYHFMLSKSFTMSGTLVMSNICLHYLMPILTLLDWLLFDPKGSYKKYSPFIWLIIPYLYVFYVYIAALFSSNHFDGNKYPYYFFDIELLGLSKVLLIILGLTLLFIILGYIIYFIDHALNVKKETSCGCIVIKDKKVLLVRHNKGHVGFPKGHVETNETYKQTAIREVKEETNIDVEILSDKVYKTKYFSKKRTIKVVYLYLAQPLNNALKKQDKEIKELFYCNYEEACKLLQYKNDLRILNKIKKLL